MFFRMIRGGFARQWRKLSLIGLTVLLGTALATAMMNVMLDVGDKINQELKTYGANLNVIPRAASMIEERYNIDGGAGLDDKYLAEAELPKLKTIFWAYNIVDFAPLLDVPVTATAMNGQPLTLPLVGTWFEKRLDLPTGESVSTGLRGLKSWWRVEGAWPTDSVDGDGAGIMAGELAARRLNLRPGATLAYAGPDGRAREVAVTGVFHGGGDEDDRLYAPLALAQALAGKPGLVRRVEVSALTTPENDLARRAARSPGSLSSAEWETWYCTAYISSIAYQIEEVLTDARAKAIRRVSESEGSILAKMELLMGLLTVLALGCSALALSNLITATVLERGREIGLIKAIGATDLSVLALILAEIVMTAAVGAAAGFGVGIVLSKWLGLFVFGTAISVSTTVIPLLAVFVVAAVALGSLPAVKLLLSLRPTQVLHGR